VNPEQLLTHFDRISEAPDAILHLRRLILDLAVRGKLVEQAPREEPASELLKQIQAEKTLLVKTGKIGKLETLPPIEPDEVPFEVPMHWELVRLGEALDLINGRAFKPNEWSTNGLPIIRIQNLNNTDAPFNYCDAPIPEKFHVQTGDFLISWSGTPGTSFGAHIWDCDKAVLNQHIFRVELIGKAFLTHFLKLAINSRLLELIDQAHGGVGLQHITKPKLKMLPLTLPPLAEQHRIVAKVDELMALCDRLEAAQTERESQRDRLVASSLHRLNNGADPDAFREHARFYFNHLPRLTTRPDHIKQLRQTILNLAVRGKLVPQDPNDEPVPELLKRIGAENSDNEPFPIPISWAWVSVDQISDSRLGKMLDKGKNKGTPRRYLRNVNVRWFDFDLSDVFQMRFEDTELDEFALRKGDVLICEGGEPGRAAVWDERENDIYFQKAIHRVRLHEGVVPHFFVNTLRQSADSGRLSGYFTGVGIKHFTGKGLSSFVFPLPPLAEQQRIVAKVDELMAICDRMETQLTTTQTESRHLLDSLLTKTLAKQTGKD